MKKIKQIKINHHNTNKALKNNHLNHLIQMIFKLKGLLVKVPNYVKKITRIKSPTKLVILLQQQT